ncbi:MAG: hypothetical protein HY290_14050 [Planctomycetia bacterium]|nr:hypothetical protein [Planctomycetia bacterium]
MDAARAFQVIVLNHDGSWDVRASNLTHEAASAVHASLLGEQNYARVIIIEDGVGGGATGRSSPPQK